MPGPADYKYDPNMRLKSQPRAVIPTARKMSSLVNEKSLSPGPHDYRFNPN